MTVPGPPSTHTLPHGLPPAHVAAAACIHGQLLLKGRLPMNSSCSRRREASSLRILYWRLPCAGAGAECTDAAPPGIFGCAEQKSFGQCRSGIAAGCRPSKAFLLICKVLGEAGWGYHGAGSGWHDTGRPSAVGTLCALPFLYPPDSRWGMQGPGRLASSCILSTP